MTDVAARLAADLADRYRLERELGAGGMATVYLAQDLKHDRRVAIKVLHPELSAVIGGERFLAEIKVTANLQHPHILPLFDSGSADGLLFYVMPLVEGESLRVKMGREKELGVEEAVRLATQVLAALDYAHRHGVVHRDIKPENVLLHDGTALVADFGIALAASHAGASRMTATGMSLGTPAYMSPEQAMGDREVDARSDVYSVATMLYEMLAGDPPYVGSNAQAIVAKVLTEKPVPVTAHRDTVPSNVAAAIQKALNKRPADRFASAAEFAKALATPGWQSGELLATTALPAAAAATTRAPRWRGPALAGGMLLAGLAGGAALRSRLHTESVQPVIRYYFGVPADQSMQQGITGVNMALSPDGSRLVYSSTGPGAPLRLRERNALDARPIPGTEVAINPVFSPDGRQLAFSAGPDLELKVVGLDGGPPATLARAGSGSAGGLAWGDDGWIYFDTPPGLSRVRPGGGAPEVVVPLDSAKGELGFAWPQVLPGSRQLIFRARRSLNPEEFEIGVYDLVRHERHVLTRGLMARLAAPGVLVYVRADGALVASRYDEKAMALVGAPLPLFEGIMTKPFGSVDLALSATGTLMYVQGAASASSVEAAWVGRDGVAEPLRPSLTVGAPNNRGMAISPDGTRLAIDAVGPKSVDVWVKQLPAGALTRLTFDGTENSRPSWTPDGQSVVFASNRGGHGVQVWRQRADGSTPAESVLAVAGQIPEARVSPDGRWLVFRRNNDSGRDLFAMRFGQDSAPVPLVVTRFNEFAIALSPDGRWLAYTSDESGRPEVYVRPFPATSAGRWQVSSGGGAFPRWAHSGRELFFESPGGDFMAATVTPGATFASAEPKRLFGGMGTQFVRSSSVPYWDVAHDDQHFLMMKVGAGASENNQIVAVDNWLAELQARMGRP
jgi:serine/threonine-protein kinase